MINHIFATAEKELRPATPVDLTHYEILVNRLPSELELKEAEDTRERFRIILSVFDEEHFAALGWSERMGPDEIADALRSVRLWASTRLAVAVAHGLAPDIAANRWIAVIESRANSLVDWKLPLD